MVVVVSEMRNHVEVVQQEVHTVEVLDSIRDLGGSVCATIWSIDWRLELTHNISLLS